MPPAQGMNGNKFAPETTTASKEVTGVPPSNNNRPIFGFANTPDKGGFGGVAPSSGPTPATFAATNGTKFGTTDMDTAFTFGQTPGTTNGIYASRHNPANTPSPASGQSGSSPETSPWYTGTPTRTSFPPAVSSNGDAKVSPPSAPNPLFPPDAASSVDKSLYVEPNLSGSTSQINNENAIFPLSNVRADAAHSLPPRKGLRLELVFLVGTASTTPSFSIDTVLLQNTGDGTAFSVETLAAGLVQGCSIQALRLYLEAFSRAQIEGRINNWVRGRHPVLFYAAERNCVDCVRLLLDYGCDVNACDGNDVPALGYAIMRSHSTVVNPAEVVEMLLAFGASPHAIPSEMWMKFLDAPSAKLVSDKIEPAAKWCTTRHLNLLALTLTLSIRYSLYKSSQASVNKERRRQLAQADGYTALLKIPFLIIGQDYATKQVSNVVATHLSMKQKTPLVMVFAGLSGHGKTELAKQMGSLLNIPMTVIDCAQMHSNTALFGAPVGYAGNAQGSQLNNHLAGHSGMRSVVFLDEFEKTHREVHNSLLLVLDSGEYHDRRNNKAIDASKTIWVMASNLGDKKITSFYRNYLQDKTPEEKVNMQYDELIDDLKGEFRDKFGPPMAGRMRNVAPFFPFDASEQAVVVHKFLMELVEQVRYPISTAPLTAHYPGHVHLAVKNDGHLCAFLAKKFYIEDLGARSLISAIDDVRIAFFTAFTDTDELVEEEMNAGPLMRFTVQMQPIIRGDGSGTALSKVGVAMDGFSSYYRGQGTGDEDEEEMEDLFDHDGADDGVDGLNEEFERMLGGDDEPDREGNKK